MKNSETFSLRSAAVSSSPLHAACATAMLLAGATQAQNAANTNAPTQLPDVTVKGQQEPTFKVDTVSSPNYTQPLLDTPQTITAVPKEVFTHQGAMTLTDVLRNTPGITFAAGEGGNVAAGDSFFLRGSDASSSIFVDGVRDSGAFSRDTFNVETVEIFKGPTGADNGRGGSSGYVNVVTKRAELSPLYAGSLQYGSADMKRLTADLNQPLSLGKEGDWLHGSAIRLNGMWQDGGVPGRDEIENNRWGVSPAIALGLGTPTRVNISGSFVSQDILPDSGLPYVALPGGAAGAVDQENYYGLKNSDFDNVESGRANVHVEHDLGAAFTVHLQSSWARTTRDSLTTYFQNSTNSLVTFPATPVNPATGNPPSSYVAVDLTNGIVTPRRLRVQQDNEIFLQQLSVVGTVETGRVEHSAGTGVDYSREEQFSPTWQPVGGPPTSLYNPDPSRPATADQTPFRAANNPYGEASIDTYGFYLFDTAKLTERWLLSGSGRVEHTDIRYESLAPGAAAATTLEGDEVLFSWKSGLTFKPIPSGSVYFAYGNSFTPAGSTFNLSATASNQNNPNLDPIEARNFELGTKWEFFERRLFTSIALFHSEVSNLSSTDVNGQTTQNIEEVLDGIEVGVSGQILPSWFVYGGFVHFVKSERHAPNTIGQDNSDLRYNPDWTANLWTEYKFPFAVTIGAGFNYSSSLKRNTSTTTQGNTFAGYEVPSFVTFNGMIAYDFTKNFSLRLNVNNIFEEETYRLNNNGGRYYPGSTRSFLLTASVTF